jgi:Molybdenum cofactor biosynthesis enzyme
MISSLSASVERDHGLPIRINSVNFILTNRCNLRCVYCPQGVS